MSVNFLRSSLERSSLEGEEIPGMTQKGVKRILIADDVLSERTQVMSSVQAIFRNCMENVQVCVVANGNEALNALSGVPFRQTVFELQRSVFKNPKTKKDTEVEKQVEVRTEECKKINPFDLAILDMEMDPGPKGFEVACLIDQLWRDRDHLEKRPIFVANTANPQILGDPESLEKIWKIRGQSVSSERLKDLFSWNFEEVKQSLIVEKNVVQLRTVLGKIRELWFPEQDFGRVANLRERRERMRSPFSSPSSPSLAAPSATPSPEAATPTSFERSPGRASPFFLDGDLFARRFSSPLVVPPSFLRGDGRGSGKKA